MRPAQLLFYFIFLLFLFFQYSHSLCIIFPDHPEWLIEHSKKALLGQTKAERLNQNVLPAPYYSTTF